VCIYIKYISFNLKIKCLTLSCNLIDVSAFMRLNIFEHVAIRERDLTLPEDSQQQRIRNAWRPTFTKVGLYTYIYIYSHTIRSNVVTARFFLIIGRLPVNLIHIFEKIPCARRSPRFKISP
jgi:hypothetical protein